MLALKWLESIEVPNCCDRICLCAFDLQSSRIMSELMLDQQVSMASD